MGYASSEEKILCKESSLGQCNVLPYNNDGLWNGTLFQVHLRISHTLPSNMATCHSGV